MYICVYVYTYVSLSLSIYIYIDISAIRESGLSQNNDFRDHSRTNQNKARLGILGWSWFQPPPK